mmetsp:Transcript_23594/g.55981  ORF Transcript_23594/g.55981 Transcript_23594/m.55981 type:complete len:239 (-) Transcript_23594:25-741(-)
MSKSKPFLEATDTASSAARRSFVTVAGRRSWTPGRQVRSCRQASRSSCATRSQRSVGTPTSLNGLTSWPNLGSLQLPSFSTKPLRFSRHSQSASAQPGSSKRSSCSWQMPCTGASKLGSFRTRRRSTQTSHAGEESTGQSPGTRSGRSSSSSSNSWSAGISPGQSSDKESSPSSSWPSLVVGSLGSSFSALSSSSKSKKPEDKFSSFTQSLPAIGIDASKLAVSTVISSFAWQDYTKG